MGKPVPQKDRSFAFLGRPTSFLKEVRMELVKVAWPTKPQAIRLTLIVIGISVIVAIFLGALDFLFTQLMTILLRK